MTPQLDLWYALDWRDCANPACAEAWGPMPPREFHISHGGLCSVCYVESRPEEKERAEDRLRYTPNRKAALVQRQRERNAQMSEAERIRRRDARREYFHQRYLSQKVPA